MRKGFYLGLLLFSCSACTMFVKAPAVTVHDFNVVSLDSAAVGMELNLTVRNENSYDLKLLGYSYDLKVLALPLAKGGARDEVSFPAGTETDLRIPVRVSYGDMLEIFKRRPDLDRVPYALQAGLDLDTPLGRLSVPVNRTGTYGVPAQYRPSSILNRLGDFLNQIKN